MNLYLQIVVNDEYVGTVTEFQAIDIHEAEKSGNLELDEDDLILTTCYNSINLTEKK